VVYLLHPTIKEYIMHVLATEVEVLVSHVRDVLTTPAFLRKFEVAVELTDQSPGENDTVGALKKQVEHELQALGEDFTFHVWNNWVSGPRPARLHVTAVTTRV
jgi:hypothetical protein